MRERIPRNDTDDIMDRVNIAGRLKDSVRRHPFKRAVVYPTGRDRFGRVAYAHLTFEQLDRESDRLAWGLESVDIKKGVRTVLMVPPGIEFFILTFALFKTGSIPVVVDPGMGIRRMVDCLRSTRPRAFVGIAKAHLLRKYYAKEFTTVKTSVVVGPRWFFGVPTLHGLIRRPWRPYTTAATGRDDMAAVLFTTGSTGPAKGAVYSHGNFDAQIDQIQAHFSIAEDEIDLPTFPLFALFDPALGMTAVIPAMDPTRPAMVDPNAIIEPVLNQGVTNMFASPALLNRIGSFGKTNNVKLPSLRRVVSAGAPVSPANIEQFSSLLGPEAQIHTPYGATEAVPVLSIASREILSETRPLSEQGFGMCVGRPINDTRVRIIRISDAPIPTWSDTLVTKNGDIGEIAVQAPLVTRHYFQNPEADALAKIVDGDRFWHRMGDLGWLDSKGRIWFCGRKSHRVTTPEGDLFTIPCEAIFNAHPQVFRSALVGIGPFGRQEPVICIERFPEAKSTDRKTLTRELLDIGQASPLTQSIQTVLYHRSFPVDIRHNSKIFREQLAKWAEKKLKGKIHIPGGN
ncbi:MAG: fatty acid CoA ligase family protein [Desulfobacterales bacterium]|jgi:acyl-CoA synthetase (AMP-forming)/AMP-acid ligase II